MAVFGGGTQGKSVFGGSSATDELTTEELLSAALARGGAAGQIATELAHPNTSIMSRVGHALGDTFNTVIQNMLLPRDVITKMINPSLNFKDIYENEISPSSQIFGPANPQNPALIKAVDWVGRFATDTLLDPLMYVGIGEVRGIMGMSKLVKIPLGEQTARSMGLPLIKTSKISKTWETYGEVESVALRDRALSDEGMNFFQKQLQRIRESSVADEVKSAYFFGQKLLNQSDDKFAKQLSRLEQKVTHTAEETTQYNLMKKVEEIRKLQKPVDYTDGAWKTYQTEQLKIATIAADKEAQLKLVRATIGAKVADYENEAKEVVSKLIESSIKRNGGRLEGSLAQVLVDQGGIKMFGKSILAGMKIRAVANIIPGFSRLDEITAPTRNAIRSLWDTGVKSAGKLPSKYIGFRAAKNVKQDILLHQLSQDITSFFRNSGITREESELLQAATDAQLPPSDPFLETMYHLINSTNGINLLKKINETGDYDAITKVFNKGRSTANRISGSELNALTPEQVKNAFLPPERIDRATHLYNAAIQIRKLNKRVALLEQNAGFPTFIHNKYAPHITVNEQTKSVNPRISVRSGTKLVHAEESKFAIYRNLKNPKDIRLVATDEPMMERLNKGVLLERSDVAFKEAMRSETGAFEKIKIEMSDFIARIKEMHAETMAKAFSKTISESTTDSLNKRALFEIVRRHAPDVNVKKLVDDHIKKYFQLGVKKHGGNTITEETLDALSARAAEGDFELKQIANSINDAISAGEIKIIRGREAVGAAGKVDKEMLQELLDMKEVIIAGKTAFIESNLDQNAMTKILSDISDLFHAHPMQIEKTLDALVARKQMIAEILENMKDIRRGFDIEQKEIFAYDAGKMGTIFVDKKTKEMYKFERAAIAELEEKFGIDGTQFEKSALHTALVRVQHGVRATTAKEFLDDVARSFGVRASQADKGFVEVELKEFQDKIPEKLSKFLTGEGGEPILFHPAIAQDIQDMLAFTFKEDGIGKTILAYDHVTNVMKAYMTSIWPMFHGRNALSNVFLAMMNLGANVLKPHYWAGTYKLMRTNSEIRRLSLEALEGNKESAKMLRELQDTPFMTDKTGFTWTLGDVHQMVQNNVVAFHPNVFGRADIVSTHRDTINAMEDSIFTRKEIAPGIKVAKDELNPFSLKFKPFQYGNVVGQEVEGAARIMVFLANLEHTGSIEHAVTMSKEFLFDYQNLTTFEREFMRRIFPFYTFTRKNLELQAKTFLQTPGRIDWMVNAYQSVGEVLAGGPLTEEERSALPEWMRRGMTAVTARNGNTLSIVTNTGLPFEQPFTDVLNLSALMSTINPLPKALIEGATGYSMFHGKPISEVTNATGFQYAPQIIKDFIGYDEKVFTTKEGKRVKLFISLRPNNMYAIKQLPLIGRSVSLLNNLTNSDQDIAVSSLSALTGLDPNQINIDAEEQKRIDELNESIQKILNDAGVGYEYKRFYIKPEYK